MPQMYLVPKDLRPDKHILTKADDFFQSVETYEVATGAQPVLYFDEKSGAYYTLCPKAPSA